MCDADRTNDCRMDCRGTWGGGTALDLTTLLREWDGGKRETRIKILRSLVASHQQKTGAELEMEYGNGASLFLTRISAWLRLTYLLGIEVALQLQAIHIFLSAASGHRFLTEYLHFGGRGVFIY